MGPKLDAHLEREEVLRVQGDERVAHSVGEEDRKLVVCVLRQVGHVEDLLRLQCTCTPAA